ncbi:MAG: helix-turn-helix domain-containing protein [Clostridia bacterium]|nr:helix-turn-helix domain-containing protein [Clostridia bacterium]
MDFKDKVYQARMQLGLTQMEFAKALGFGFATINRWENGSTKPNKLKEYSFEQFCIKNNIQFCKDEENKQNETY